MRPRELHLRGFTAFRVMAEPVSFLDADLFALTGPTGSGKTSLLDAICFALYGRVPRLDARAVEPVISLGAQEARIGFEFSVGPRIFTVARVVRRTKAGATTPEARLEEHIDEVREVLASGADQVSETVTRLLGLTFDQFTKAVLLPQGAFAAFLHDTPAKRQELLRSLLDLGVYERMRDLAQLRRARAEGEAEACRRDLARLGHATEEAETAAQARLADMADLLEAVSGAQPQIDSLKRSIGEVDAALAGDLGVLEAVQAVRVPNEVADITSAIDVAASKLESAEQALQTVSAAVDLAEQELGETPPLADLMTVRQMWEGRAQVGDRVERGRLVTEEAEVAEAAAREALVAAEKATQDAAAELQRSETAHQGHALAQRLQPGDECPVCARPVPELPSRPAPEGLEDARRRYEDAAAAMRKAAEGAANAGARLESCRSTLSEVSVELESLDEALVDRPSAAEVTELVARVEGVTAKLARLRADERAAQTAFRDAQVVLSAAREREVAGRRVLSSIRDTVAAADPPELELVDLASDWELLAKWAHETSTQLAARLEARRAERADLAVGLAQLEAALDERVAAAGLPAGSGPRMEQVVRAHSEAEQQLDRLREDRRLAAETERRAAEALGEAELAKAMARHLQANGFEGWLMAEALDALVIGANRLLAELSAGAYSLRMDKRDFSIIDHRNADETRGVRTLSGGETFLVSLALALALSDHIGSMAAEGAARLESIFLDEGFGTLDSETLEVVADVIAELGATGRTVGLVTHVKELAELVPVRFEVTRDPGGSRVQRIPS